MQRILPHVWGHLTWPLRKAHRFGWMDLALVAAMAGILGALLEVARIWTGPLHQAVNIDLSPAALPGYAFQSLLRGLIAYALSLVFTLFYGYWAARDRAAERVLIPLLDILQSIPVLAFMPGLVLALVNLVPGTNIGLELATIIMIFTGQVWNMTFSFYHSLRSLPADLKEVATVYRFRAMERLRWLELPFAAIGLIWNSMMSMAGGWFFLMVSEAFILKDKDFRLPGLGSYMSVAAARGDAGAMIAAMLTMIVMIVLLDQFLWRPVLAWAQKFRTEESAGAEVTTSWFLNGVRHSRLVRWLRRRARRRPPAVHRAAPAGPEAPERRGAGRIVSAVLFTVLLVALAAVAFRLVALVARLPLPRWPSLVGAGVLTLLRVLTAVALGTLWTLPAGLAIGLSPKLSRPLAPVVQVMASFPAPMLFPMVVAVFTALDVSLNWGSIALMLLGTQWYILFNVIAGAMAIPGDLREAATSFRLSRWQRFRRLYLPAVLPYLVTGWVTAAGGAWNASIVAEYATFRGRALFADGLGATISQAAEQGNFALLAASVALMSTMVVIFNRSVWQRLARLAETRYMVR